MLTSTSMGKPRPRINWNGFQIQEGVIDLPQLEIESHPSLSWPFSLPLFLTSIEIQSHEIRSENGCLSKLCDSKKQRSRISIKRVVHHREIIRIDPDNTITKRFLVNFYLTLENRVNLEKNFINAVRLE